MRIPTGFDYFIRWIDTENEDLANFLLNSVPDKTIEFFMFGDDYKIPSLYFYYYGIREVVSRTIEHFRIGTMVISNEELWWLVKAAKYAKQISFIRWRILSDSEWDFGDMIDWKIDKFSIQSVGIYSSWKSKPMRWTNIMSGIANWSSFISSVTQIIMYGSDMNTDCLKNILDKVKEQITKNATKIPEILFN